MHSLLILSSIGGSFCHSSSHSLIRYRRASFVRLGASCCTSSQGIHGRLTGSRCSLSSSIRDLGNSSGTNRVQGTFTDLATYVLDHILVFVGSLTLGIVLSQLGNTTLDCFFSWLTEQIGQHLSCTGTGEGVSFKAPDQNTGGSSQRCSDSSSHLACIRGHLNLCVSRLHATVYQFTELRRLCIEGIEVTAHHISSDLLVRTTCFQTTNGSQDGSIFGCSHSSTSSRVAHLSSQNSSSTSVVRHSQLARTFYEFGHRASSQQGTKCVNRSTDQVGVVFSGIGNSSIRLTANDFQLSYQLTIGFNVLFHLCQDVPVIQTVQRFSHIAATLTFIRLQTVRPFRSVSQARGHSRTSVIIDQSNTQGSQATERLTQTS